MIGNRIDIEKHRARNMRGEIVVDRQRHDAGQLERRVDNANFRIVDMGSEPIGRDERIVRGKCDRVSNLVQRHCEKPLRRSNPVLAPLWIASLRSQ